MPRGPWLAWLSRWAPERALRSLEPRDPRYGRAGERLAERHLRRRGFALLARRLRTRWGELDLVMRDGGVLVVVEVKTGRAGPRFRPAARVSREDLERRWRAAAELARGAPHRVDVVEVRLWPLEVVHLRGPRLTP